MSRFAQAVAPLLKLLLVVGIIAAWVEANAKWFPPEPDPAPASSFSKAAPQAPGAGNCPPAAERRKAMRVVPARPAVIRT